jgi:V/A-type H+-transporting ATPase subunit I
MYPTAMTKLTIIGPKTKQEEVISSLYKQNIYHIVDHKKSEELDIGMPLENSKSLSNMLVIARSILSHIKSENYKEMPYAIDKKILEKQLNLLHGEVKNLLNKKHDSKQKIKILNKKLEILKVLDEFNIQAKNICSTKKIEFNIGKVKNTVNLTKDLENISKDIEVKIKDNEIALIYKKEDKEQIISILNQKQFMPYDISSIDEVKEINKQEIKIVEKETIQQKEKLELNIFELRKLGIRKTNELLKIEDYLTEESEKSDSPLKFASTKDAFIIHGFVPSTNLNKTKRKLELITEGKIYFKESKPTKTDNVPVQLDNPKITKPFEFLLHMYSIPKINEIDPTRLMFLTFPLFFGFMLGDFGYGLLLLIFFSLLKKKIPSGKALFNILIISAIGTMVFGLVFGEYFGFEEMPPSVADALGNYGIHIIPHEVNIAGGHGAEAGPAELVYPTPKLLERSHQINDLLSISILIGILHIIFGLIIGFINTFRQHGIKDAIFEKIGWLLLIPGLIWILLTINIVTGNLATTLANILPSSLIIIILSILGALFLLIGEGFIGLIELPSLLSNTLSYARLMAVGLASVKLAAIINEFAGEMFHAGGWTILGGIAILLVGHTINILLGLIGPFLHSLRLHYVEFFSKFFKGGGILFRPFGKEAKEE